MKERFYIDTYGGTCSITRNDLKHILTLKTEIKIDAFVNECTVEEIKKWLVWMF